MLSQARCPIAYSSEKLLGSRSCYSTYDAEFYAMVQAVKHWRHYLFQHEFILCTDHDVLKHHHNQDKVSTRHASWSAYLQQFTFVLKHKADMTNRVADALSRRNSLLITMKVEVSGFDSFYDLFITNPFFSAIVTAIKTGERSDYILHDGYLFRDNQFVHSRL